MSKLLLSVFTSLMVIVFENNKCRAFVNQTMVTEYSDTIIDGNKIKSTDYTFFSDSVFHGQKQILKCYLTKYNSDTCPIVIYDKRELKRDFEGIFKLGRINKKTMTSVFVLNPLDECNEGQSYYFTDTTLPRLQTDSYCCHPSNIFLVGDIDEDGFSEIGQYYSSCSSHYKSLLIWTLKNNHWKQIGYSVFDQHYMTYNKPFSSYIKKLAKGKFEMFERTDLTDNKTKIGKWSRIKFSM